MTLLLLVALGGIGWWGVRRWHRSQPDHLIDELIAKNTATPKPGMGSVDWSKVGRWGAQRWHEKLLAQSRSRKAWGRDFRKVS